MSDTPAIAKRPPIPENWVTNRDNLDKGWFVQSIGSASVIVYTLYWQMRPAASVTIHVETGPTGPVVVMPDNHMLDVPPSTDAVPDRMKQGDDFAKH